MRSDIPPRLATWILARLVPNTDRDAVIGDLLEEHALRFRSESVPNASWWYWSQVSRSAQPLVWTAVRRGGWLETLGAAIAAYLLVNMIQSAGGLAVWRLLGDMPLAAGLISLTIVLSAMVLGGYIATRMRRGAAVMLAVISALSVIRSMAPTGDSIPVGYFVGWLVACPLAALAGGALLPSRET
jgi:hypothetical protein